jgi:hypothetical protein
MTEPIPFHVQGHPIDPDPRRLAAALRSVPEPPEPVEVTDTDGVVLGAFGSWRASWMNPGQVAQLRRMEALERMERAEREAERQERADNRWQNWLMRRAARWPPLKPFDISRPSTMMLTGDQLAERIFAAMESEDRRNEVRAKIESSEWHLIDTRGAPPAVSSASLGAAGSALPVGPSRSASSPEETPSRTRLLDQITAWRHCGLDGETPCGCERCTRHHRVVARH